MLWPNRRRKEVSLFGKMPFYEDYLRHRCFNGNAGAYREWLEEGFDIATRDNESPSQLIEPRRVMFFPAGSKSAVVGSLRDSSDRDGVRRFPFTAYVSSHVAAVPREASRQVIELGPTWDAMDQLVDRVGSLRHVDAFRRVAQQIAPPNESGDALPEPRPTVHQFARHLAPSGVDEVEHFAELLWRVKRSFEHAIDSDVPLGVRPAIRIPIVDSVSTTLQAWVWLRLLEGAGMLGAVGKRRTSFAFPAEGTSGPLWVIPRPPTPRDFGVLCDQTDGFLSYEPNGDPAGSRDGFNGFRERMEEFLFARDSRFEALADFPL